MTVYLSFPLLYWGILQFSLHPELNSFQENDAKLPPVLPNGKAELLAEFDN